MAWSPWTCYKFADFATRPGFVDLVGVGNVAPSTTPPHFLSGGALFDNYYPATAYDRSGTRNPMQRTNTNPVGAYTHPTPGTSPYLIAGPNGLCNGNFNVNVGGVWGNAVLDRYEYRADCGVFQTDLLAWPYNQFRVALFHLAGGVWWGVTFYYLMWYKGGNYDHYYQWEVWELTGSQNGNGTYARIGRVRYRGSTFDAENDSNFGGGMGLNSFVVSRVVRATVAGEPAFPGD